MTTSSNRRRSDSFYGRQRLGPSPSVRYMYVYTCTSLRARAACDLRFVIIYIYTYSAYTSSGPENHSVPPVPALQRIEVELDTLAMSQQQGCRDIQELKDDIQVIKDDLSALLANRRAPCDSRMKIPPQLSV